MHSLGHKRGHEYNKRSETDHGVKSKGFGSYVGTRRKVTGNLVVDQRGGKGCVRMPIIFLRWVNIWPRIATVQQTGGRRVSRDGEVEGSPLDIAIVTIIIPFQRQKKSKKFQKISSVSQAAGLVATKHSLKLCKFSKSNRRR